ncbi:MULTISPECIES: hypothetical protein [unclassified Microbacterium]|uniref:hypothetical protein n=1 Tax=unclassified Microbacterium TaxID=2609290 RepID=UPI000EA8E10D|nr:MULTISPECIES: hypothetical protein [unclassified Microbacterium]MBT2484810.1 hypothetical protein [Microbacterium sp. ISL-108]RKN67683.1 hypothetical protein D7252_08850 [Microbacterium sp. CGR2]
MIEPLNLQVARGQRAAADLRDAENMMRRMAAWDQLLAQEKAAEYEKGKESRYADLPDFAPVFCVDCRDDVFPDFTKEPDGACPFDINHVLGTHALDRAAA